MSGGFYRIVLGLFALCVAAAAPASAKDRAIEFDWRTGVAVAPGAMTWTADNYKNKQQLIGDVASAQGRTCTDNYAFLGWGIGHGGPPVIMDATRASYEKAGYTVEERQGAVATDIVWVVRNAAREAVILWGGIDGSTIYLSCITAGSAAPNPEKPLYIAVLSVLGLAGLLGGWWMFHRVRALGKAALGWPSVAGVVKSNEIRSFKMKSGKQFKAQVTYSYDVGGTAYAGDRLRFGQYAGALAAAEADAAKYPVGAPIEVRYDPKKPQSSVLEPGVAGTSVLGIVLAVTGGIFLVLVGLVAAIT